MEDSQSIHSFARRPDVRSLLGAFLQKRRRRKRKKKI